MATYTITHKGAEDEKGRTNLFEVAKGNHKATIRVYYAGGLETVSGAAWIAGKIKKQQGGAAWTRLWKPAVEANGQPIAVNC